MKYPNLKQSKVIVLDIETKDPFLKEKGSGVYRKDGLILGVGLGDGRFFEYYNLNHPGVSWEEKGRNLKYIKDMLSTEIPKLGANILYDIDWLENYQNIPVKGLWHDIQIAEPLIDEYRRSYSLDSLAQHYLKEHKKNTSMFEWCKRNNIEVKKDIRSYIYKMPYKIVRPYGIGDVQQTYQIFLKQYPLLKEKGLLEIYDLERKLLKFTLLLRKIGVKIDYKRYKNTSEYLYNALEKGEKDLFSLSKKEFNLNSGPQISKIFNSFNIKYPLTEKGNPNMDKKALGQINHPIAKNILKLRHIKTLINFFIKPYSQCIVNNRIHCNFHQLKSDNYGTVSGRYSSTKPNLQQVSGKNEDSEENEFLKGRIIRKLFIPEKDHLWLRNDFSQIEYRFIAHYANGQNSDYIRERYNTDPNTDYHHELGELTGITDRKTVKTLNFGAAYGMGYKRISKEYFWTLDYAKEMYNLYHAKVPFVKSTMYKVGKVAKQRGFIRTILGRQAHLQNPNKAYVMFNRLIQGSAADLMKKSQLEAFEAGIFDTLIPHLTVHDEIDCSIPRTKAGLEAAKELQYIMENCIKLKVPIKIGSEIGENWGELKDFNYENIS